MICCWHIVREFFFVLTEKYSYEEHKSGVRTAAILKRDKIVWFEPTALRKAVICI